ncbi:hypothetical protein JMN32_01800 [Fulvivirga sp. 29W222]|uniref:Uncharacterized protein n=1 Tax=Fulvivirga marina TaxID=2494733 RepID=A0A937KC95_9BACT|nr:hypothetical protein [Fulvivirga marina]MBL6445023.1 hypothetical protein [Fulvivirga marina]
MEQKYINNQQLREFVQQHELMNSHSIIQFNSIVSITTAKNKLTNEQMRIMVTYDGYDSYGQLTLLESDIDPYLFPTVFEAKWQNIKHVDNEYLEINGVHTQNQDIGKYIVKIIPLKRLEE